MSREAMDVSAATVATKATYTGGGTAALAGLTANEWLAIAGVVVAVLGFLTNLYFQRRRDLREEREHELEVLEQTRRIQKMNSQRGDL